MDYRKNGYSLVNNVTFPHASIEVTDKDVKELLV